MKTKLENPIRSMDRIGSRTLSLASTTMMPMPILITIPMPIPVTIPVPTRTTRSLESERNFFLKNIAKDNHFEVMLIHASARF